MRGGETWFYARNDLVNLNQMPKKSFWGNEIHFSDVCSGGNDSKQDNLYFQMPSGNRFSPKDTTPVLLILT